MLGIERLAMRIQLLQLMTGQGVEQQLEGKLDAFAHRLDRLVIRVRQLETALRLSATASRSPANFSSANLCAFSTSCSARRRMFCSSAATRSD